MTKCCDRLWPLLPKLDLVCTDLLPPACGMIATLSSDTWISPALTGLQAGEHTLSFVEKNSLLCMIPTLNRDILAYSRGWKLEVEKLGPTTSNFQPRTRYNILSLNSVDRGDVDCMLQWYHKAEEKKPPIQTTPEFKHITKRRRRLYTGFL